MAGYRRVLTHVTCRLTAKNRDRLRNPTLGNRASASFTRFSFGDSERVRVRVMREVNMMARLNHKNIVRYYDSWFDDWAPDLSRVGGLATPPIPTVGNSTDSGGGGGLGLLGSRSPASGRSAAATGSSRRSPYTVTRFEDTRTLKYDTRRYINVRSKANMSQLNLPHGTDN